MRDRRVVAAVAVIVVLLLLVGLYAIRPEPDAMAADAAALGVEDESPEPEASDTPEAEDAGREEEDGSPVSLLAFVANANDFGPSARSRDQFRPDDVWAGVDFSHAPEWAGELIPALRDDYRELSEADAVERFGDRIGQQGQDDLEVLLLLELERIAAHHERSTAFAAFEKEHGLPERTRETYAEYQRALKQVEHLAPPLDFDSLRSGADAAVERLGKGELADVAAAYRTEANCNSLVLTEDNQGRCIDSAFRALQLTDDPNVINSTLNQLGGLPGYADFTAEELDWLEDLLDNHPDLTTAQSLSTHGLEAALVAEDWERGRRWRNLYERFAERECAPEVVASRPGTERWCLMMEVGLDTRGGYLAAHDDKPAATWREALVAKAIQCYRSEAALDVKSLGQWGETGWRFESSEEPFGCIAGELAPEPPEGTEVELRVVKR